MSKKMMLILVAHDPVIDPRITWTATSASEFLSVKVLGLGSDRGAESVDFERKFGVEIAKVAVPLKRAIANLGRYLWKVSSWPMKLLFAFLAVVFLPAVIFASILAFIASSLSKFVRDRLRNSTRVRTFRTEFMTWARRSIPLYSALKAANSERDFMFSLFKIFVSTNDAFLTFWHTLDVKPQIVHCNDLDTLVAGVMIKRLSVAKLVYDAHEFYPYQFVGLSRFSIFFLRQLESILIRQVDACVTVSSGLADEMQRQYKLKRSIEVVPNCCPKAADLPASANVALTSSNSHESRPERVLFLYQGLFAEGRGIKELIELWLKLAPKEATLILRGPDSKYKSECIHLVDSFLEKNVSIAFEAPAKEDELVSAASRCHVGIIPYEPITINNKYCCPNKLSQYMSAGLAILHNDLPFVREVAKKAGCGVEYRSSSEQSFAEAISQLMDAQRRKQLSENARRASLDFFNWETQFRTFQKIYDELM